jgi:hypothetical protein
VLSSRGAVAQFGRALDWQSRGQGFKSPQLHRQTPWSRVPFSRLWVSWLRPCPPSVRNTRTQGRWNLAIIVLEEHGEALAALAAYLARMCSLVGAMVNAGSESPEMTFTGDSGVDQPEAHLSGSWMAILGMGRFDIRPSQVWVRFGATAHPNAAD